MRRLVDNTLALVRAGELSAELAAQKLHESGVPMAVIGRVLSGFPSEQLSAVPLEPSPEPRPLTVARRAPTPNEESPSITPGLTVLAPPSPSV